MDVLIIKVIIRPSLDIIGGSILNLSHISIEKKIALDPKILIKDLCRKIMEKMDLGDLADQSQAFIQHSNMEYYPLKSLCPNINTEIGSVSTLFNQKLAVEILVPLRFKDIIKLQEIDVIYRNLFQYLLLKVPEIEDHIPDAVDKYFNDEGKGNPSLREVSLKTLLRINEEIIHAIKLYIGSMDEIPTPTPGEGRDSGISSISCEVDVRNHDSVDSGKDSNGGETPVLDDGNSNPMESQGNQEEVPSDTKPNKSRAVRFNKDTELPILENWYKILRGMPPVDCDFQNYASALNIISMRKDPNMITPDNISNWYKRKRQNERRQVYGRKQANE
uniref:Homeobox domain-containing protein n=1 Tax=Strongyloides venezuelensis TaxID=75913 RepID=A0A0K0EZF2_STRVS